jgi:thymidylate kinase
LLLDIAPTTAVSRKRANRDKFESDLALLERVRASYLRLFRSLPGWHLIDGEQPRDTVSTAINAIVATQLALP